MKTIHHAFRDLPSDDMQALQDNFLVSSWSFSKLASFARNEKQFEMQHIYRCKSKLSATTVAGLAYHHALECYFKERKEGVIIDLPTMEIKAYEFIDNFSYNHWKLQKTSPSVEECIIKAGKVVSQLLKNFIGELSVYKDEIGEILFVEPFITEFLVVNRVDIPLPCNGKIDLVFKTKDGKNVIVDHKSKASFSDDKDLKFSIGKQAIAYVLLLEEATEIEVNEVWFVENKYSKNKNGSAQLKAFKVEINEDTRRLYEAMLYEPLKRFIEATSDPDYVYLMNDNDNLTDKAELYEFWAKTMIAEVNEFNIPDDKKELVSKRLKKIRDAEMAGIDPKIIKNFQDNASQFIQYDLSNKNMTNQEKIEHILRTFGVIIQVAHVIEGYSSNTYLLEISAGTAIANIHRRKMDIANALDVANVRIMKDLFVYEGKSYVAIESSKKREKDLLWNPDALSGMKIPLGEDNFHRPVIWDLNNPSTPHMLICGATGSGKSVSIKSTIEYAIMAGVDKIVIFDPKFEFSEYKTRLGIEVYSNIDEIELEMMTLVETMNGLVKSGQHMKTLVVFDEFADAVSASRKGNELKNYENVVVGVYKDGSPKMQRKHTSTDKSLEENLKILLQKGRSSGFRILSATQRASAKVITGDAKVNFPVQVCFRVPKEIDSKVVLDESGAEALTGKGDGLIRSPEYPDVVRFQAYYKPANS